MDVGDTYTDTDGLWLVTAVNQSGEVVSAALTEPSQGYLSRLPMPVEPEPVIDRGDLLLAIFATLGKPKARLLASAYPDAQIAINHGNWTVLGEAMDEMIQAGDLSAQEASDLNALFQQFGVTVV